MTTNNDAQTLQSRRERVAADWTWHHGPVLIPAGLPIPIDGTDQFHDFHAHPEFRYLSGVAEPGATLAWDPDNGWTLFTPTLSIEDRVWMSQPPSTQEQTRRSGAPPKNSPPSPNGWKTDADNPWHSWATAISNPAPPNTPLPTGPAWNSTSTNTPPNDWAKPWPNADAPKTTWNSPNSNTPSTPPSPDTSAHNAPHDTA